MKNVKGVKKGWPDKGYNICTLYKVKCIKLERY